MKTQKKFYHYYNYDRRPLVNEVVYPHCPFPAEYHKSFLVYAENEKQAFALAMDHIYNGLPMSKFSGDYKGERYDEIMCVM